MRRFLRSEAASIPLVILVAIIVGGVMVVMFANTRQSQRSSAFDRDFAAAIQAADAGLQSAFTYLVAQDPDDLVPVGDVLDSVDLNGDGGLPAVAPEVGDGTFSWLAKRTGSQSWEIRSSGEYRGVVRVLESSFGPFDLFNTAMYGHVGLSGNYPANSPSPHTPDWHATRSFPPGIGAYDSRTGDVLVDDPDIVAGTSDAGGCAFNPAPDDLDQIMFGDGDLSGCQGRNEPLPEFPDLARQAFDTGVCSSPTAPLPTGITEREWSWSPSADGDFQRGTVYCLEGQDLVFPRAHVARLIGDPSAGHVEVYVENRLVVQGNGVPGRKYINVSQDSDGPVPAAADLRLFFADAGETINITNNNHVWMAATIYAPKRACQFGTQTILYGAATCYEITLQGGGGFRFYYDVATADLTADSVTALESWSEEGVASTSFDWPDLSS